MVCRGGVVQTERKIKFGCCGIRCGYAEGGDDTVWRSDDH